MSHVRCLLLRLTIAATAPRSAVAQLWVVRRRSRLVNTRKSLLLAACTLLAGCSAQQLSPPIQGTVVFAGTKEPVADATVTAYRSTFATQTQTDAKGRFRLAPITATPRSSLFRVQWPPLVVAAWHPGMLPSTTWQESGPVPGVDRAHDPFAVSEPLTMNFTLKGYDPNGL